MRTHALIALCGLLILVSKTEAQTGSNLTPLSRTAVAVETHLAKPVPVSDCFTLVRNPNYTMQSVCPDPDSTTCSNPCDSCVLFGLTWNGTCALSGFTMSVNGSKCFFGCVELDLPTHPAWDPDRTDCDDAPINWTPQAPYYTPVQPGQTIIVRVCANASDYPLTIHIHGSDCNNEPCDLEFTL